MLKTPATGVPSAYIKKRFAVVTQLGWIAFSKVNTTLAVADTPVAASNGTVVTVGAFKSMVELYTASRNVAGTVPLS